MAETQATTDEASNDDKPLATFDELEKARVMYMRKIESLDDVGTLATFTGKIKAIALELAENGEVEVYAGEGAPEGIVGNYPDFWVTIRFEQGAVYQAVDALNDDLVDMHLLEHHDVDVVADEGTYRRTYVEIMLTPSVDFPTGESQ